VRVLSSGSDLARGDPDDLPLLPDRDRIAGALVLAESFADGTVERAIDLDAFVEDAIDVGSVLSLRALGLP
jgi:hypothetical protein